MEQGKAMSFPSPPLRRKKKCKKFRGISFVHNAYRERIMYRRGNLRLYYISYKNMHCVYLLLDMSAVKYIIRGFYMDYLICSRHMPCMDGLQYIHTI